MVQLVAYSSEYRGDALSLIQGFCWHIINTSKLRLKPRKTLMPGRRKVIAFILSRQKMTWLAFCIWEAAAARAIGWKMFL